MRKTLLPYANLIWVFFVLAIGPSLQAQNCPGLSSISLTVVAAPQPNINGPADFCPGASATLNVTQTFDSYDWSTGATTQSITVNAPGTYTVTVTNATGCSGTDNFVLNQTPAPAPDITAAPYTCNGQLSLNAGAGFSSYSWSTGQSVNPITVNSSGTYSVTVTNATGCTGIDAFDATIPTPPTVSISGNTTFCANSTTTLTASSGLSSYTWSNGQNGASITVATAGNYTVTGTDAFGCTATATTAVTTLPPPQPTINAPAAVCTGETATFTVPGVFNSYDWSSGQNTQSITVNTAGTYTVTVTDNNACTGTVSATLSLFALPQPNISQSPYQCDGQLTLNAGPGFVNYNWSNGLGTNPVTVSTGGNYEVTVTDNNGCTATDQFLADIPADPVVTITGDNQFCENQSASLEATPGFNNYAWSNGQGGQNTIVLNAGTYTVTATDGFGCTDTDNFTVDELPAPVPTIDGPGSVCDGASATLSVPGAFNSYDWSNGQNGPSITVNAAGAYTVTVTDGSGCTGTASETLNLLAAPQPFISAAPYQCDGQLSLNAGGGFSNYNWSTGQSINPISVNATNNYTVTVTDANGCTGVDVFFADIPVDPVVGITGDNQFCEGESAQLQATPGFNNYVWSNFQTGQNISVAAGGTYTVTATDNFGCTATDGFTVNELPAPAPAIAGPASVCDGVSATLSAPNGFNSYVWSNGVFTPSITVNAAGTYSVTVTDSNGCTGTDDQALNLLPAPQPNIAADPYACNNQLSLNAGGGFSTYSWSSGQNGPGIVVTLNDDYSVTVTGANGCTGSDLFSADIPVDPLVDISGNNAFCQGGNSVLTASAGLNAYVWSTGETTQNITVNQTGNFEVTATDGFGCTATDVFSVQTLNNPTPAISGPTTICVGGAATFNVLGNFSAYAWSTGESTQSITVSNPDTYTVTVTALNGCTGSDVQTLTLSNSLSPEIAQQPYTCNGQITLDAGSGFGTYAWSGGQNTQTISVTNPGDYTVTVTDGTGCSGSDLISVAIPVAPSVAINGAPAICQNTTTVLSATPGFNAYAWSNAQVGPNVTVGAAGAYTVTATDNFGCTATAVFNLNLNALPIANISGPGVICVNSNATLSAAAGLAAYAWSTAETTASISVNTAGTYSVTVTDNNGCTNTGSASVTVGAQPTPQITQQPYACNAQITLNANAGFSTYTWSSGQNTPDISAATSGTYGLTVSDANGCTGTTTIQVDVPALPVAAILGPTTFCDGGSVALNAAAPGIASYAWSTGETTPSITTGLGGPVTLTVTDAQGCTDAAGVVLTPQPLPAPQISGPSGICAGNTATLSIPGAFTSITWSNGSNASAITVTAAGNYGATVTDANGCVGSTSADLVVNANPTVIITQAPYQCNQQIGLDASPGFAGYTWTGGQTTPSVDVIQTGVYSVTVTDANGCTGTATESVSVPQLTQVVITGSPQFCEGGSSTLSAIPGFVSYSWSTGQTGTDIAFTQPDTYSVTATDALGCTSVAGANVSTFLPPQPVISGPSTVCPGSTANLSVPGNFVAYLWSNGAVTPTINLQPPVSVVLTVTDANGCTGTVTANVGISNQIKPTIMVVQQPCETTAVLDAGAGYQSYLWSTGANTAQISTTQAGAYSVTVADGAGCSGTAQVNVDVPVLPIVNITGEDRFCPGEAAQLQASVGFVNYAWSNGAVTPGILATQAGVYSLTATDGAGCTATATFAVEALTAPSTQITGPALICGGGTASLTAGSGFASYQWSNGQSGVQINVSQPGTYGVTVTDNNGCTGAAQTQLTPGAADSTFVQALSCNPLNVGTAVQTYTGTGGCDSVVVTQTTLGGAFSATIDIDSDFNGFGVSCTGGADGFATAVPLGGQAPFQYQWSNGAATATAANIGAGQYTVTITDAAGCSGTATAALSQPTPVLPVIEALGPSCSAPGAITVQSVGGGFGPYTVRLFQDVGVTNGSQVLSFDDLEEGTFTVEVTDANGCTAEELIVLTPIEVINEIVGDTIEIFPGDTVTLNAPITITPVDIVWTSPNATLSCDDCLTPSLAPVRTTELQLFVQGYGDCSAEGRYVILVKTGKQVYIPNVIAPESGTDNNRFTLYGDESVVNIRSLQIYDRWGGKMAVFLNIQPNRPELGWDGRFQGSYMLPGVYVYWAEIEYADGTTEVFQGDLTLVR